ncbi:MAG: hypothetical protein GTO45_06695 [Candidatus Aminicenantes bacterium]|nr:hypothetical protein [Candidatus Aminicenantes bacterium]NIM78530.1 hypothetical protein [Candidatus Aminicenantes bacterium]NIN17775.1 hypothetical protein [Candidatus Aminicenantes bacterium]NIN41677.1 hypothetical protein [Candidatus Aminicenantes bacterium]NIN84426.1 hypothetical protein [Candidatus Aminicenantes bacterium]
MPLSRELNSTEMDSAIQAFKDWRSSREKMCRIPECLWEIAVKLSPQYPINTICKNLGLNWGALKKKIDHLSLSSNANHPVKPPKQPSFVELKLNSQELAPSLFLNDSPSPRCAIELTKPDGTVMKIFASNDAPLNLLELFQTFLGTGGNSRTGRKTK